MVRDVYRYYTCDHMSIGAIARKLNERAVPTSSGRSRWERSVVWAMLRNPAYKGRACFGKTRTAPRQRVRPLRQRDGFAGRNSVGHERPREDWIEIAVPAIVSEHTFALAEERLQQNKVFSSRRTKTPSVSQGLVACGKCGYALYRTSARTSARKISYYRCLGSDAWRYLNGPLCNSRPVRQDLLDDIVWTELVRLLEDPALVKAEIDRRLEAARVSDPNQQREADLRHRLIRVRKGIDRLVTAYQEELITIDELRDRTPELRRQEQALHRELQSAVDRAQDRETYLRLAETLTDFLARLRSSAETLDIAERQRIVRLLVKEVLGHRGQNHHPPLHPDLGLARRRSGAVETRQRRPRRRKVTFCVQGVASPVLANVFLHYVLDLWFDKKWRPNAPDGEAIIVRYADDIVVGFQHKRDAERYLRDVRERLARFGLSLHQDKTRLVEFGRFAVKNRRQRGVGKPETFDFLGFTHYCTTTRRGRFRLGRKPVAKRVNRTLARIDEVLRKRWHHDIWEVGKWLGRVCEGWLNYFAVPGSGRFIRAFHRRLQRLWMRALRRRSQRARFSWKRLERITEILWSRASIRHPWPDQRFAVNHPR